MTSRFEVVVACAMCEGWLPETPLAMAPHVCAGCGGDLEEIEPDGSQYLDEEMTE